jgi:hypothetical protein
MRSQKFNVVSDRAFDPLRLYAGVTVIVMLEHRALPCDFPGGWRGRKHLTDDRLAPFRDYCPAIFRISDGMRIAFDHAVTLNALNRIIHFQRGAPILSERIGLPPSIMAALPKAMIFAGFRTSGDVRLFYGACTVFVQLRTEGGKLNDLRGFGGHDCTAFPAGAVITASIAATMVARSW